MAEKLFVKAGWPKSVYDFIKDAHEAGGKFYCCSPSLDLFDMTKDDLIPECEEIIGGAHLIEQVTEEEDCMVVTTDRARTAFMAHATTPVQQHIGDPVSDKPPVTRVKLETIFKDIQSDLRYDHERATAASIAASAPQHVRPTESARNVLRPLSRLGRGQVNAGAGHPDDRSVRGEDGCGQLRRMCLRTPRTALVSAI